MLLCVDPVRFDDKLEWFPTDWQGSVSCVDAGWLSTSKHDKRCVLSGDTFGDLTTAVDAVEIEKNNGVK